MSAPIVDVVEAVNVYPIKSAQAALLRGAPITVAPVGPTGFEINGVRDRDYVLIDATTGAFVTQRGLGSSGEKVRYPGDRGLASLRVSIERDHLELSAPGHGQLELATTAHEGTPMVVEIFGDPLPVRDAGPAAAAYLSRLLDRPVTLVRADRERTRGLPPEFQRPEAANDVAGADSSPFMMASLASLGSLHASRGLPPGSIPIERFRASIVIRGDELGAFGEDRIDALRVGEMRARVVDGCARCTITNIDQQTGQYLGGGLRLLRGRGGTSVATGSDGVFFGVDLNHIYSPGQVVRVGDRVTIEDFSDVPNVMLRGT